MLNYPQASTGIQQPILEDTMPVPWSSPPWLNHLQEFLHWVNGQVILDKVWKPLPQWAGDKFIMDKVVKLLLKPRLYKILNNIRITIGNVAEVYSVFTALSFLAQPL